MKKTELKVEGMTCTNCAKTVTRFLERKGMEDVYVNFATKEVSFLDNSNGTSYERIKSGIGKLGFEVMEEVSEKEESAFWNLNVQLIIATLFTLPLFFGHFLMMAGIHWDWMMSPTSQLIFCIPVFMIGVKHFGKSAWNGLKMGTTNMDVLIIVGSSAAFVYSLVGWFSENHDYIFFETCATIITLVLLGNWIEKKAVERTTHAIEDLANLQSKEAYLFKEGRTEKVAISKLKVGDVLQVNEGDAVPLDGELLQGTASIDESMLTGESLPVSKNIGSFLTGASIVKSGNFRMKVTAVGKDTVLNKIIDLVKNAQANPPDIQKLADRISAIFVPVVLGVSLLTFVLAFLVFNVPFEKSLMNAIAVLVISCPCAMGLATPTAIMVGVGRAAKEGILIRGSRTLEIFAGVKNIVFDKTGTLTEGKFMIRDVEIIEGEKEHLLSIIKSLEKYSSHPLAQSLVGEIKSEKEIEFSEVEEIKGLKIQGKDGKGNIWEIGSHKINDLIPENSSHNIFIIKNNKYVAALTLDDQVKKEIPLLLDYFNAEEINTHLLSGDKENRVASFSKELNISNYKSEVKPEEKYKEIEALKKHQSVAMVGDGINDAAALAMADVGLTFGNATDIAVKSAGIVLLNDNTASIVQAHKISKHTLLTIKQNLFWAFAYNIVAIPVAALGFLNPMWGALFMAFSDIVVIGNSLRLRRKKI